MIYVQHCGPEGDALHPSKPGHALFSALEAEPDDLRIAKESCDAFLNTSLAKTLEDLGVTELIITGFATECNRCFQATSNQGMRSPTLWMG